MDLDYDVAVVGAGINGVGVALAAAAAGHRVVVFEQSAPAAGTSSRSSKLIHGGLRYLEQFEFSLVRESLRERATLLANAPDLVRLVPFHIPVYRHTRRRPWLIACGLALYTLLGGGRFASVPRREWAGLDGIETAGLEAVFRYYDAATDDAALTRAVLAAAVGLGATLHCPAAVEGIELLSAGARLTVRQGGEEASTTARVVVNAAGPWVNEVLGRVTPAQTPAPIDLVAGTHLVVAGTVTAGAYYVEVPDDGRAIFVLPWKGQILVGTTERPFTGDPGSIAPLPEDEVYLLGLLRRYFPKFAKAQVVEAFAGIRVLPGAAPGGHGPFTRSREIFFTRDLAEAGTPPRLLTLYGGKLTAFRATAAKACAQIAPALPPATPRADWAHIQLKPVANDCMDAGGRATQEQLPRTDKENA